MEIPEVFKTHIKTNHCNAILEFGCGDGTGTRELLDLLQESKKAFKFHGFEPNLDCIQKIIPKMKYYLSSFEDVKLYNEAIGMVTDKVMFYKGNGEDYNMSSTRAPKRVLEGRPDLSFTETQVPCIKLDDHMVRAGFSQMGIDFIIADIQGAEIDLIRGARETLKRTKYFYTRYSNTELYQGQMSVNRIFTALRDFEIIKHFDRAVLLRNKKIAI